MPPHLQNLLQLSPDGVKLYGPALGSSNSALLGSDMRRKTTSVACDRQATQTQSAATRNSGGKHTILFAARRSGGQRKQRVASTCLILTLPSPSLITSHLEQHWPSNCQNPRPLELRTLSPTTKLAHTMWSLVAHKQERPNVTMDIAMLCSATITGLCQPNAPQPGTVKSSLPREPATLSTPAAPNETPPQPYVAMRGAVAGAAARRTAPAANASAGEQAEANRRAAPQARPHKTSRAHPPHPQP